MTSNFVDRIDPFHNKASIKGRKQKRSQGSSHYRTKGCSELTALPQLKGDFSRLFT
jgi:serine/threonine-protein phosphatase 2A regulatory subunit B'